MINKPFDQIALQDIEDLKINLVPERKTIEYKAILTLDSDGQQKEFLYDISSFANADGGDIIYGIKSNKEDSTPLSIDGITGNKDAIILRVENIIRDRIEPRILDVRTAAIPLGSDKFILIIRIPKSLNAPHAVTYQSSSKFYTRGSNGKYLMNVFDLRSSFLQSATITERIKQFVLNRVSMISANETPVLLENQARLILHLVPLQSLQNGRSIVSSEQIKERSLNPIGVDYYDSNYFNLEGYLKYTRTVNAENAKAYIQIYRTGIIETVDSELLQIQGKTKCIYVIKGYSVEEKIIKSVQDFFAFYKKVDFSSPCYLFLTLVGVKGYIICNRNDADRMFYKKGIDRDVLYLPEVEFQTLPETDKVPDALRNLFDVLWNACGYEKCLSFDASGKFSPKDGNTY